MSLALCLAGARGAGWRARRASTAMVVCLTRRVLCCPRWRIALVLFIDGTLILPSSPLLARIFRARTCAAAFEASPYHIGCTRMTVAFSPRKTGAARALVPINLRGHVPVRVRRRPSQQLSLPELRAAKETDVAIGSGLPKFRRNSSLFFARPAGCSWTCS